ncbi:UTP--glucose-1-phosphate uridylyltransferase [Methylobacterium gnaphalii]|uniref:HAD-IIIA family hydrolase n=1 Tax=Methylobacterium gnaphalii TaxID=1010610 RepID=UPI001EE33FC4|nr:HAD-IIIA family hydrolase [Methylobacterium gnaphalii]GJD69993.1 UTP--glucose-1-phosphate uridylyltransferase [Methylobacterium gnaphalii]
MKRQAVILAGGKGTRLQERLAGRPKPLIDVGGVPLLERQLTLLASNGFTEALLLVNHAADQIEAFCASARLEISVTTINDGDAKGTAGAVLSAYSQLDERFLVVYGDTLFDVDLERFWRVHVEAAAEATLFLHPNDHPNDSDLVALGHSGNITGFYGYPHPAGSLLPNLVNAALYIVERQALSRWLQQSFPLDFAKDLFPAMVAAGQRLRGYTSFEYIKDIGTPDRLDKASHHLETGLVERARRKHLQKAVFFDRDGTLNDLAGYVRHHSEFSLLPGTAEAIRRLNEAEYRVAVITNQPVIARGEASVEDLTLIHNKMETELGRKGAWLDLIKYCPHHPDSGFPDEVKSLKITCDCRKPGIAMIEEASTQLNIDKKISWMVGDSTTDVLAANRAGLRSVLVRTGEGGLDHRANARPDVIVDDVAAATRFILDVYPSLCIVLEPLVRKIRPGDLVMIGGCAKLGKTTIATVLSWFLNEKQYSNRVLELDCFIRSATSRDGGSVFSRYELELAIELISPWLSNGESIAIIPR